MPAVVIGLNSLKSQVEAIFRLNIQHWSTILALLCIQYMLFLKRHRCEARNIFIIACKYGTQPITQSASLLL